ncbi:citrate transporter [candidate division KSB1 bacterium]|nr:citrate transporter [candidate division KSB1 bacterium]
MTLVQILQLTGFFIVFLGLALSMFFRKLPALLALPLMAILISLLGGVSPHDLFYHVIGAGSIRLHNAYTVAIFGGMLSFLLQKSGVAENLIKNGAELAGDRPWSVGFIMLLLIAMLFTTLGGLGAIIMVATIVLPILSSVGFSSLTIAGLFLIGVNLGGLLNAGNWALYIDIMHLDIDTIRSFALTLFGIAFIMALGFLTIEIQRDGQKLPLKKFLVRGLLAGIGVFILAAAYFRVRDHVFFIDLWRTLTLIIKWGLIAITALTFLQILYDFAKKLTDRERYMSRIKWYAYLTPLVPLILILVLRMSFITAFVIGLIYGFIATFRKGSINMLSQSIIEGGASVMPAVVLMMGIGMLLNAIMGPGAEWSALHAHSEWPVLAFLKPAMANIIPSSPLIYVLVFTVLAPLALYRGPLNVWGMGYGMAAIMLASGSLAAAAIMGLLISVGTIQGICDPTNTHNVWIANELHLDTQEILWRTLPYVWVVAAVGLMVSAVWYF